MIRLPVVQAQTEVGEVQRLPTSIFVQQSIEFGGVLRDSTMGGYDGGKGLVLVVDVVTGFGAGIRSGGDGRGSTTSGVGLYIVFRRNGVGLIVELGRNRTGDVGGHFRVRVFGRAGVRGASFADWTLQRFG